MARTEGAHITYLLVPVTMESAAAAVNIDDIIVHATRDKALWHAVSSTPQQRYALVRNGQSLAAAIAAAEKALSGEAAVELRELRTTMKPAARS